MITAPTNWNTLWGNPETLLDVQVIIHLDSSVALTYTNADLTSCSVQAALFNDLSLGNVCSARLSIALKDALNELNSFAKGQKVELKCRLRKGSTSTAYVKQGVYYVETVTPNHNGDVSISAYDELYGLKDCISQHTSTITFSSYLSKIRTMYGLTFAYSYATAARLADGTTVGAIKIPAGLADVSAREVLSSVASIAGGNFAIDKSNNLRLYRIGNGDTTTASAGGIPVTAASIKKDFLPTVITGVNLKSGSSTFKSDSGWRIDCAVHGGFNPSADTAKTIVKNMRTEKKNVRFSNVQVDGALIDPLFELGDVVSVDMGGEFYNFPVCDYSVGYSGGCWGSLQNGMSGNAVDFSIEQSYSSQNGWYDGWIPTSLNSGYSAPVIKFDSKHQIRVGDIDLSSKDANYSMADVRAFVKTGDNTYEQTKQFVFNNVSYWAGGQLKTIPTITAYLENRNYPVERREDDYESTTERGRCYIDNLILYTVEEMPDDAIGGKSRNGMPLFKNSGSSYSYTDKIASIYFNKIFQ